MGKAELFSPLLNDIKALTPFGWEDFVQLNYIHPVIVSSNYHIFFSIKQTKDDLISLEKLAAAVQNEFPRLPIDFDTKR